MENVIRGVDRDGNGIIVGDATMLVERRGSVWYDAGYNAPIKAVRAPDGSTYIVGDDAVDWDGPCFGGEFLLDEGEVERVGMPVTMEV